MASVKADSSLWFLSTKGEVVTQSLHPLLGLMQRLWPTLLLTLIMEQDCDLVMRSIEEWNDLQDLL